MTHHMLKLPLLNLEFRHIIEQALVWVRRYLKERARKEDEPEHKSASKREKEKENST